MPLDRQTRPPEFIATFIEPPDWARPNPDMAWEENKPPRSATPRRNFSPRPREQAGISS